MYTKEKTVSTPATVTKLNSICSAMHNDRGNYYRDINEPIKMTRHFFLPLILLTLLLPVGVVGKSIAEQCGHYNQEFYLSGQLGAQFHYICSDLCRTGSQGTKAECTPNDKAVMDHCASYVSCLELPPSQDSSAGAPTSLIIGLVVGAIAITITITIAITWLNNNRKKRRNTHNITGPGQGSEDTVHMNPATHGEQNVNNDEDPPAEYQTATRESDPLRGLEEANT